MFAANSQTGIVYAVAGSRAKIAGNLSDFYHAVIGLDLSQGSDIYGSSETVMPPSINLPVGIYLGRPK